MSKRENAPPEKIKDAQKQDTERVTEAWYRAIYENSPLAIFVWDRTRRVVDWNLQAERVFGWTREEVLGRDFYTFLIPQSAISHVEEVVNLLLEGTIPKSSPNENYTKQGETILCEWSSSIQRDSHGKVIGIIAMALDITERKKAEDELRKSKLITDNMPVGLYLYHLKNLDDDRTLRMVYANPAVKTLTGVGPEEVIGRTIDESFPNLRAQGIPQRYAEIVRTQKMLACEDVTYEDNRVMKTTYSVNAFPLPGNMVGIAFENITERKQMEVALREAAIKWQTTFNALESAVWLLDKEMRIIVANNATQKIFCKSQQDVMGHHCWEIVHGSQKPIAECPVVRSKQTLRRETTELNAEGQWYEVTSDPVVRDRETLIGYVHVVNNITERKKLESERREFELRLNQTQRLESLGVLAGGIAHDFNNILMAIMGYAELALDDLSPLSPGRENIAGIVAAAKRAADLCGQMLAYAGKIHVERRNMAVGELVEETLHLLKTCISKKAILNLNLEKSLPCIHGDPAQIRQILMNLVLNASDAIGERSGVITISTGAMDCSEHYLSKGYIVPPGNAGTYVYIEVSDTGCGMDKKTIERIFEPFFTTKFTGRGLGLSAIMGIVKAHEGALRVYSEPWKGSTFKVMFPAVETAKECACEDTKKNEWRGVGTVLIVDDEESIRAISAMQLRRLGLNVLTAEDGRKAIDIYRTHNDEIDIVLLDLTMPHMNGEEAYRKLRQINPDVRVILASGYSESDIASRFAGKGLSGCMQKPYTLIKLSEMLSQLLPKAEASEHSDKKEPSQKE